ncbi:MAG: hypothetical protein NTY38_28060 [Acidobacteria bacterium]|nr:hypothetical protein [Acidobacteriota bacterium]
MQILHIAFSAIMLPVECLAKRQRQGKEEQKERSHKKSFTTEVPILSLSGRGAASVPV